MEYNEDSKKVLIHPHSTIHRAEMAAHGDNKLKPSIKHYTATLDYNDPSKGKLTSTSSSKNEPQSLKSKLLSIYHNKSQ